MSYELWVMGGWGEEKGFRVVDVDEEEGVAGGGAAGFATIFLLDDSPKIVY